jgi:hypothetical protein
LTPCIGGQGSYGSGMPHDANDEPATFFLLSPAKCGGERARALVNPNSRSDLARRLQSAEGAGLGEVFAFLSALYFRGKLTYARTFARTPHGVPGVLVITPNDGLCSEDERLDAQRLQRFGEVDIHHRDERYTLPLLRDARALSERADPRARFVLLGSVASGKYVDVLMQCFGDRLLFPSDFVGRGDMSRGGLLLRSAQEGRELGYRPVRGAVLRGPRPPRLPALPCRSV